MFDGGPLYIVPKSAHDVLRKGREWAEAAERLRQARLVGDLQGVDDWAKREAIARTELLLAIRKAKERIEE